MEDYVKVLSETYEQYEEVRAEIKNQQNLVKDMKNKMMDIIKDSGTEFVIIPGLDTDTIKLSVENIERKVLDKKMIADQLDMKVKEIDKIQEWVKLTKEGKITPEMIEEAMKEEIREQFVAEPYEEKE